MMVISSIQGFTSENPITKRQAFKEAGSSTISGTSSSLTAAPSSISSASSTLTASPSTLQAQTKPLAAESKPITAPSAAIEQYPKIQPETASKDSERLAKIQESAQLLETHQQALKKADEAAKPALTQAIADLQAQIQEEVKHVSLDAVVTNPKAVTTSLRDGKISLVESYDEGVAHQPGANSEIPFIRKNYTERGIDGEGTTIVVLDLQQAHGNAVTSVINSQEVGVAPGAKVNTVMFQKFSSFPPSLEDSAEGLQEFIATMTKNFQTDVAQNLDKIAEEADSSTRVVNMSFGTTRQGVANMLFDNLAFEVDEEGNFQGLGALFTQEEYQGIRQDLFGDKQIETIGDVIEARNIINDFVDATYSIPDIYGPLTLQQTKIAGILNAGKNAYDTAIQKLADKNIVVVNSAGNDGRAPIYGFNLEGSPQPVGVQMETSEHPSHQFNLLSQNNSVISVAASNSNNTPGQVADDTIAGWSSRGEGQAAVRYGWQTWNPTLAAPGESVEVDINGSETGGILGAHGTSFSSPYVAGAIALLLDQNANTTLTTGAIYSKLVAAAVDTAADRREEGFGMLSLARLLRVQRTPRAALSLNPRPRPRFEITPLIPTRTAAQAAS